MYHTVDWYTPAVVNALHHPPKGAFPQSANNLICNTTRREKKDRKSRERQNSSIRRGDFGGTTEHKVQTGGQILAPILFSKWLPI